MSTTRRLANLYDTNCPKRRLANIERMRALQREWLERDAQAEREVRAKHMGQP